MQTLPIELINEILYYLPLNELWRHYKTCRANADPLSHIFLAALRRSHKFDLSSTDFQQELTIQLVELENRIIDGKRRRDNHKNTCIENLAKHDAKTICKYFDQTACSKLDRESSPEKCIDSLIFYLDEVASAILRQCLDMTKIPTTLVTLHTKICQYLLSPWISPVPRTYTRLYRFLRSLSYDQCGELYSKLESSLWDISHKAFMVMMKRHTNIQLESTVYQSLPSTNDKIFDRYVLNSHYTHESLLRISCVCGSVLNFDREMLNDSKVSEDASGMVELCLSVCIGATSSISEKILASSCILCFFLKCCKARDEIPSLARAISSTWNDLSIACERSSRCATAESVKWEELQVIFRLILLLIDGCDISDVFTTGLIPSKIHRPTTDMDDSHTGTPFSYFPMLQKCQLLILEPVS
ncbi:hypothetical protein INT43_005569 [Umbelopsis isabellina]|uniref:F-box domain-containing protein n=1 Tax=Mortierella isabellina TaxID=91625 RepID=A0A8H7PM93_MORIS|nr:hypothetical protein INT43_005569 [Umbelopsis isabellina]